MIAPIREPAIRLDPIAPRHAPDVQRLASDPAIGATSNVPSPYPEGAAEAWITAERAKRDQGTSHAFAVLDEADQLIGVVTLMAVDRKAGTAGLGYWIGTPYWGRGYATAATLACVRFARDELGISRIGAACLGRNAASRRVLEKTGFRVVGAAKPSDRGPVLAYEWQSDQPAD